MAAITHQRSFRLPDLGEGLETAEITAWEIAAGDEVMLNQTLCRVETAKAEVEVPSPFVGRVVDRNGEVGDEVPVGFVLVTVEVDGPAPDRGAEAATAARSDAVEPVLVGYGASPGSPSGSRRRVTRSRPIRSGRSRRGHSLPPRLAPIGPGTAIPVKGVRATIAERMSASRSEIPDATCGVWVDATRLLARRNELQAILDRDALAPKLTPFAMVAALTVVALRRHRELNATLDTEANQIWLLDDINLGFATATEHGLVVPVAHDAHRLTLRELAAELARLAAAARDRSIPPAELLGGTFTISNFGGFGVDDGIPVINHPEAAILGVGAVRQRPWVVDGSLAVRSVVKLTCAFDHRICDGAEAAGFLRTLADLIERAEIDLDLTSS